MHEAMTKEERDAQSETLSVLYDPLCDWPNDDLMLDWEMQERVKREFPKSFRVLDWEDLRTAFKHHDDLANDGRRRSRSAGVWAVVLATLGMILTAVTPLITDPSSTLQHVLGGIAACVLLLGIGGGFVHSVRGRKRYAWLKNRFQAERLRQVYFQTLLRHFDLATRAMHDDTALAEWTDIRNRILVDFKEKNLKSVASAFRAMQHDIANQGAWVDPGKACMTGASYQHDGRNDENARELLTVLRQQRIGVQIHYVDRSLHDTVHSPLWRFRVLRYAADAMSIGVMIISIVLALYLVGGSALPSTVLLLIALTAIGAALPTCLRTLEQGLGYGAQAERLAWYLAMLHSFDRRFETLRIAGRLRILQELEEVSYHEMRSFLNAHARARFVFQ